MGERAAYSRVYWEIVDDPKFVTVYDSDAHLAAWLRLLLIADQAHPASAHLPSNVRRTSIAELSGVGLIDLLPGHRYRVHGLDAERKRRSDAATSRPPKDTGGGPNGGRSDTTGVQDTGPKTRRDEDKTSLAETQPRATVETYDTADRPDLEAFLLIHRRVPSPRQRQVLDGILQRHDVTGGQWAADIMLAHPDDAIGAVIAADKQWRDERIEEAKSAERKPTPIRRPRRQGLSGVSAELAALWREMEAKNGEAS